MREKGYVTMLDPFDLKYGKWLAAFLYLTTLISGVLYYGAVLAALGDTMSKVVNMDVKVSIISSGAVAVLYTMAGGMYSVTYTDVVELFFILIGLWLCIPFCFHNNEVGPISVSDTHFWGTIKPMEAGQWIDGILLFTLGGIPWQEYFQRVLSSRTAFIAKVLSCAAGLGCILVAVPAVVVGIMARNVDWNNTSFGHQPTGDQEISMVLPISLMSLTPQVVAFLGLGSIAAATMSSTDAGILAGSTQFLRIWYKNLFRPQASERELLWVLRGAMVVFGAASTCIALTVKTIYVILYLASDLPYVILFPQLTCVLFWESYCNVWGATAAFVICMLLRLLCGEPVIGLPAVIKFPLYDEKHQVQTLPYKSFLMLIGFILIPGVSKVADNLKERLLPISSRVKDPITPAQNTELTVLSGDILKPSTNNVIQGCENIGFC